MIKPHDYQNEIIEKSLSKLEAKKSVLIQAATGAGKTVIMSFICKEWIKNKKGKIVITVHRKELVDQTVATLRDIGIEAQSFTASSRKKFQFVDVYVAMVETLNRRLEKSKFDTEGVTLVISDECHILVHHKIYGYFPDAKIIGFTATPVIMKRKKYFECKYCKKQSEDITDCCGEEMEEWTKPFAMSELYEDIVVGPPIEKLIDVGQLVRDISFKKKYADVSSLKTDSTGEYTAKSLDQTYSSDDAVFNVKLNYEELCKGKRTMIFNPSTKVNALVYESLRDAGYNVKMYDSVNESDVSRTQLVEWFNSHDDAILCNCGIFTTGFDSREVEAIIVNRATKSLSLYLQIVGRGGRSSYKIFKDSFIHIDGGGNIDEFGEWSDERDWEKIFWQGIGKPKPKRIMPEDIQDCPECGYYFEKHESVCPGCGYVIEPPSRAEKVIIESEDVLEPVRAIPPPSGKHIYEYVKRNNGDINMAFRILQSRIVDMFKYYRVTADLYERTKNNGNLDKKIKKHMLKPYFFLIGQQDINTGQRRTIEYMMNKTKEKLEKYYYGN